MTTFNTAVQETRQLKQRGKRLLRYGKLLLVIAQVLAVFCVGTWFIADWYQPQSHDFSLDVPQTLIDSVKEARGNGLNGLTDELSDSLKTVMGLLVGFAVVGFIARIMLYAAEILIQNFRESRKPSRKVMYMVLIVLGIVGIPYACLYGWNQASLFLKDSDHQQFVEKLNQKEMPNQIKYSWSYEYVQVQQAVLSGHPDKSKIQDVLKKQLNEQIQYDIPAPVRYAFETQAFQRPVSDKAKAFQADQERHSSIMRKVSVTCLSGALLLAFAGLTALLTGKTVWRRVKFLRAIR